jgi:Holliday junction resolvasome RuvABC ATP-dependent DNA helicase subunit
MTQNATEAVPIARERLLELSRDLNTLVVSLDRLGSEYSQDRDALERALADFVIEWSVVDRLARGREIVDRALLGPNPTPEEEDALDHGEYWEPKG